MSCKATSQHQHSNACSLDGGKDTLNWYNIDEKNWTHYNLAKNKSHDCVSMWWGRGEYRQFSLRNFHFNIMKSTKKFTFLSFTWVYSRLSLTIFAWFYLAWFYQNRSFTKLPLEKHVATFSKLKMKKMWTLFFIQKFCAFMETIFMFLSFSYFSSCLINGPTLKQPFLMKNTGKIQHQRACGTRTLCSPHRQISSTKKDVKVQLPLSLCSWTKTHISILTGHEQLFPGWSEAL